MAFQARVSRAEQASLFRQMEEVLQHSLQERPLVLLLVVGPAVFTAIVVLTSRVLPLSAAIPLAVIATIPGTAVAWCSGVLASKSWDQASKTVGQIIRTQLQKGRRIALLEAESPLYVDWYVTLRLAEELHRSKRYGCPLSVLVLAPDGRASYDRVGLAEGLRHALRSSDLAGAMCDDQVVLVLPNSGLQQARRVRQRFQPVAARFGYAIAVAALKPETIDSDELIESALQNLRKHPRRKREQKLAA